MEPLTQLYALIKHRQTELSTYAQRSDAKDFIINRENVLLDKLTSIFNELEAQTLKHYSYWQHSEEEIERMLHADPEIGYVSIILVLRPQKLHGSQIILNPYA